MQSTHGDAGRLLNHAAALHVNEAQSAANAKAPVVNMVLCLKNYERLKWLKECLETVSICLSALRLTLLTLGMSIWGRGVVTEEPPDATAQRRRAALASKARPLPARIDVLGINHTITASPEFGTYYRCARGLGDCKDVLLNVCTFAY